MTISLSSATPNTSCPSVRRATGSFTVVVALVFVVSGVCVSSSVSFCSSVDDAAVVVVVVVTVVVRKVGSGVVGGSGFAVGCVVVVVVVVVVGGAVVVVVCTVVVVGGVVVIGVVGQLIQSTEVPGGVDYASKSMGRKLDLWVHNTEIYQKDYGNGGLQYVMQ